ncbi:17589_t:CDS:2 [Funneliformis caledonium]|uniref:17589_t:CDS:1 n=1 Tax=Funneliformis caledonium TaxID=1117310 RepID=A0A9N9HVR3_9GLOM|nr:17589_t:CDS:2 [Funneliformis caledonium]
MTFSNSSTSSISLDINQDTSDEEKTSGNKTDILSNTDNSENKEAINVYNVNNIQ